MRLSDGLFVVGGGDAGFGLSGRLDANCYLIDTGNGLWLVDVGFDAADRIIDNIRAEGFDPADVTCVFLTHHHADHAGAAADLKARLPGEVTFAISVAIAENVRAGDSVANGFRWAQEVGFYPAGVRLQPIAIDLEVHDRQQFRSGDVVLTALETPGHCAGHMSYLVEGAGPTSLISGDLVFWNGRILLQNLPDVSIAAYAKSMAKVAELEFAALLPGHSGVSLAHGRRHIDLALGHFQRIGIPPALF